MNDTATIFAQIDITLRSRGIHLDADSEDFLDGKRPLDLDELLALLPQATENQICAYAETRWAQMRDSQLAPASLDIRYDPLL